MINKAEVLIAELPREEGYSQIHKLRVCATQQSMFFASLNQEPGIDIPIFSDKSVPMGVCSSSILTQFQCLQLYMDILL